MLSFQGERRGKNNIRIRNKLKAWEEEEEEGGGG